MFVVENYAAFRRFVLPPTQGESVRLVYQYWSGLRLNERTEGSRRAPFTVFRQTHGFVA